MGCGTSSIYAGAVELRRPCGVAISVIGKVAVQSVASIYHRIMTYFLGFRSKAHNRIMHRSKRALSVLLGSREDTMLNHWPLGSTQLQYCQTYQVLRLSGLNSIAL